MALGVLWLLISLLLVGLLFATNAYRFRLDATGKLPSFAEIDVRVQKAQARSWFGVLAWVALYVYSLIGARGMLGYETVPVKQNILAGVLLILLSVALGAATLVRAKHDREFTQEHPEFKTDLPPMNLVLQQTALTVVPFTLMAIGFMQGDLRLILPCFLLAIVLFLARSRMSLAVMSKFQVPLDLGSPFAQRVAEVMALAGKPLQKLIRTPSLIVNAFALPTGTVLLTSCLCQVCSEDEQLAILAHEATHLKHGDVKRMQILRLLSVYALVPMLLGHMFYGGEAIARDWVIPHVICSVALAFILSQLVTARAFHKMEYRADAGAGGAISPEAMSTALIKIHRAMGLPLDWSGWRKVAVTHPSLRQRLVALLGSEESASKLVQSVA